MSAEEQARWNMIYRERVQGAYPPPDALLAAYAPKPGPGETPSALDLAAGLCQNAIWLAEQGYQVDAMDFSRVALERGRAEMAMRNLRSVNFIPVDLDMVELPENTYDLVCVFRFLDRRLFPPLRAAVRPGGMIVYQTLNVRWLERRPDTRRVFLLEIGELPTFFPGWEVLHSDDADHMSRFVGRRPDVGGR